MTIKEAFEKLHKAVKKAGLNPFFLIGNLKDTFKDVAANVEDGSTVEVQRIQQSGVAVGNIKVNGVDNYLFAPQSSNSYSTQEHWVGYFYHDNISEDVYERTFIKDDLNFQDSFAVIDSNFTYSAMKDILSYTGSVRTADGVGITSLCGLPGMSLWIFGVHNNINGLGLYGNNANALQGGRAVVTVRYTKNI